MIFSYPIADTIGVPRGLFPRKPMAAYAYSSMRLRNDGCSPAALGIAPLQVYDSMRRSSICLSPSDLLSRFERGPGAGLLPIRV